MRHKNFRAIYIDGDEFLWRITCDQKAIKINT